MSGLMAISQLRVVGCTASKSSAFMDIFTKAKRPEMMSRIRGSGNKDTELRLIQIFRANGITGWRRGATLQWKVESEKLKVNRKT